MDLGIHLDVEKLDDPKLHRIAVKKSLRICDTLLHLCDTVEANFEVEACPKELSHSVSAGPYMYVDVTSATDLFTQTFPTCTHLVSFGVRSSASESWS